MNLKDTMFPVREIPAVCELDDKFTIKEDRGESSGYKFIVREDTGKVLSCVTDKYKVVQNYSVIQAAEPILKESGAVLTEAQSFGNGARSTWTWKIPDIKVKIDKKDFVNPTITLRNSYDGSVQLHILAGAFRLVCSNGLVIGTTISNKVNKHSVYNLNLDKVEESVKDTINSIQTVFSKDFTKLVETKVKPNHVQNLIEMFPDFTIEPLTQYLLSHKIHTYWDLLNAATWVSTHTMKRNYETTHKLESKIYPSITKWASQVAKS